jgi:acyl-CoA thioester hydrolase
MLTESELKMHAIADGYRFWIKQQLRPRDMDINRHVNNVVYLVLAECARVELRSALTQPSSENWVISSQSARYIKPAYYPGEIRIGTAVTSIGKTSFVLVYGLFQDAECVAVVSARSVHIGESGKPAPLSNQLRVGLSRYVWSV